MEKKNNPFLDSNLKNIHFKGIFNISKLIKTVFSHKSDKKNCKTEEF